VHQNDSSNLAHAIHFTVEDLIANRNGYLSEPQMAHVKREIEQNRTWSKYSLVLVALMYFLVVGIALVTDFDRFVSDPREATGLAMGTGIFILGLALSGILTFRGYRSPRQLHVHEVTGVAKRETSESDGSMYRIIRVNRIQFTVEEEIYDAFRDGLFYRIFYVRFFRHYLRMLSAEELTPDT